MRPTEPFRREHKELKAHVEHIRQAAGELPRLAPEERAAVVERVVAFLRDTLVPHAQAEEAVLYPEWAKLLGFDGAAIPMVHDHAAIVARIEQLGETGVDDVDKLQELLYGLYALIAVHFEKEEELQLPAFDAAPPEVAAAALERMEALAGHGGRHGH
jgi:hemerythrin superfamily protein